MRNINLSKKTLYLLTLMTVFGACNREPKIISDNRYYAVSTQDTVTVIGVWHSNKHGRPKTILRYAYKDGTIKQQTFLRGDDNDKYDDARFVERGDRIIIGQYGTFVKNLTANNLVK